MSNLSKNYSIVLSDLKEKIRRSRLQAAVTANNLLLVIYWEIGYTLNEQERAEGWGAKTVETLAMDLRLEFPDMKGLSTRNLRYMRDFAVAYPQFLILQDPVAKLKTEDSEAGQILQRSVAKLPWGHNCTLLDKLKLTHERLFYAVKSIENGWSRDVLILQIDSKLYLRKGNAITNFEVTLPKHQSDLARESLKNPYVFDFLSISEEIQEKELEKALIQHIKKFMLELGKGFAYVGNQYNLNVEGDDYFLDLLFYNYHLHCFVVFELKIGEFKPEFAGKLNFYINTIDEQVKGKEDKPTIGVLLCKTPNQTTIKFALKSINTPIGVASYELANTLPKHFKAKMPSVEELEKELEAEAEKLQRHVNKKLYRIKEMLAKVKTEEIQREKSIEDVLAIYNEVVEPVEKLVKEKLSEILSLFNQCSFARIINDKSNETFASPEVIDVAELEGVYKLGLRIWLEGFKKAGFKTYNIWKSMEIKLEKYKYSILFENNNVYKEKLYHQEWKANEIQELADKFSNDILDDLSPRIQALLDKEESL